MLLGICSSGGFWREGMEGLLGDGRIIGGGMKGLP